MNIIIYQVSIRSARAYHTVCFISVVCYISTMPAIPHYKCSPPTTLPVKYSPSIVGACSNIAEGSCFRIASNQSR